MVSINHLRAGIESPGRFCTEQQRSDAGGFLPRPSGWCPSGGAILVQLQDSQDTAWADATDTNSTTVPELCKGQSKRAKQKSEEKDVK